MTLFNRLFNESAVLAGKNKTVKTVQLIQTSVSDPIITLLLAESDFHQLMSIATCPTRRTNIIYESP